MILFCALPVASAHQHGVILLAQNADRDKAAEPASPTAAAAANSPEQIRKAQIELKRLDCLTGRIDGKLGEQTRDAVKKFWASAKRPPITEVNITDEMIADLAEHGDNYCRPARPFFAVGGRSGGNAAQLPFFAPSGSPSGRPAPASPPATPPPVVPDAQ